MTLHNPIHRLLRRPDAKQWMYFERMYDMMIAYARRCRFDAVPIGPSVLLVRVEGNELVQAGIVTLFDEHGAAKDGAAIIDRAIGALSSDLAGFVELAAANGAPVLRMRIADRLHEVSVDNPLELLRPGASAMPLDPGRACEREHGGFGTWLPAVAGTDIPLDDDHVCGFRRR